MPALTRAGIPAVVGMQFKVYDANAIAFSSIFYQTLAAGEPVDTAVREGRLAIYFNRSNDDERDWGVPVLYLHAEEEEGVLFPRADGSNPQAVTKTAEKDKPLMPEPPPQIPWNEDIDRRVLRIKMVWHLGPTDLEMVCQTVEDLLKRTGVPLPTDGRINVDSLRGPTLPAQIQSLIEYCHRRGYLGHLVAALRMERPDTDW